MPIVTPKTGSEIVAEENKQEFEKSLNRIFYMNSRGDKTNDIQIVPLYDFDSALTEKSLFKVEGLEVWLDATGVAEINNSLDEDEQRLPRKIIVVKTFQNPAYDPYLYLSQEGTLKSMEPKGVVGEWNGTGYVDTYPEHPIQESEMFFLPCLWLNPPYEDGDEPTIEELLTPRLFAFDKKTVYKGLAAAKEVRGTITGQWLQIRPEANVGKDGKRRVTGYNVNRMGSAEEWLETTGASLEDIRGFQEKKKVEYDGKQYTLYDFELDFNPYRFMGYKTREDVVELFARVNVEIPEVPAEHMEEYEVDKVALFDLIEPVEKED